MLSEKFKYKNSHDPKKGIKPKLEKIRKIIDEQMLGESLENDISKDLSKIMAKIQKRVPVNKSTPKQR